MSEPPVSVPIEKGIKPAETLTPEPEDDPPAVCTIYQFRETHNGGKGVSYRAVKIRQWATRRSSVVG